MSRAADIIEFCETLLAVPDGAHAGQPLRLHEAVDGWVLRSVHSRGATFEHSGQVRQLSLQRAKVGEAVRGTPLGSTPVPR